MTRAPIPGPYHPEGKLILDPIGRVVGSVSGNASVPAVAATAALFAGSLELAKAAAWTRQALLAIEAFEADISMGSKLDDGFEIGRIDESNGMPSFRIKVGHIRKIAAALANIEGCEK